MERQRHVIIDKASSRRFSANFSLPDCCCGSYKEFVENGPVILPPPPPFCKTEFSECANAQNGPRGQCPDCCISLHFVLL
ncbi:hypothetical protein DERP_014296 [Dermatophagoides pteronyssinus]|uniref:Uncharacterized protein n=1 Tax=Dermatophagoides pteronyssinus TaxID=6956 RepID=A0ABQ8IXH8_DERPT|nr:hypothetical protein DERP_014296 [Dermatophagoides pteronyssinus]